MSLAKDNDVIEELSPKRTDEALGIAVLPRRTWRRPELFDAQVLDASVENGPVNPVSVADQPLDHRRVGPDRLNDLCASTRRADAT